MKKVMLIEDDNNLVRVVGDCLKANNYDFSFAHNGNEGINNVLEKQYDILLVDLMLPGVSGFDIIRELRGRGKTLPIIIISAKFQLSDKINGLKIGADDYLVKPFDYDELLARIESHLRREDYSSLSNINETDNDWLNKTHKTITFDKLKINFLTHEVTKNKSLIELSKIEYSLLAYLLLHSNRVVTNEELFEKVWGYQDNLSLRTIYVHIAWLRKKIEDKNHKYIKTVRGVGYQFII